MKNLLKKNQIIITALAIMIAIAGYLNLTKDTVADEKDKVDGLVAQSSDYESYTEDDLLAENAIPGAELEISDEDKTADNTYEVTTSGSGELIADTEGQDEASQDEASQDEASQDEGISAPGEAILASTTLGADYFSSTKLKREQTRSRNKEMLMDLLADTSVTEEQRDLAFSKIVELAEVAEIENATELLLVAKGFDDAVVSIVDDSIDVVVNASEVTDRQIAQIEDIVIRKSGMEADNIHVFAVVAQD